MIDFQALVESILILEEDPGSEKDPLVDSVGQFLAKKTVDIQNLWKTKYKDFHLPREEDIKGIAYIAAKNVTRDTAKAAGYPYIESLFPILDIAGELKQSVFTNTKKPNEKLAVDLFNEWVNNVKSDPSPSPITYTSKFEVASWVDSVRAAFYKTKNQGVGDARLERLDQNLSIYGVIATLMELRKKDMTKKLPPNFAQINTTGFVDTVITKYAKVEGGSIPMRDEKINKIYDDATSSKLLNAAQAAYNYFKGEAQEKAGIQDPSSQKSVMNDQRLYELFIGRGEKTAPPVDWTKEIARIKKTPPAETETKPEPITYSLQNVFAASKGNNQPAKTLIGALTALADYIRTQKEFDLTGALNKTADVASALTLGVV
jgi:hypothetical protein